MLLWLIQRAAVLAAVALIAGGVATGMTAANTVPAPHAVTITRAITANDLKPAACTMNLVDVVEVASSPGTQLGTAGNDLILGGPGKDTLGDKGGQGTDCCVGGGGADVYKPSCTVHQP